MGILISYISNRYYDCNLIVIKNFFNLGYMVMVRWKNITWNFDLPILYMVMVYGYMVWLVGIWLF